MSLSQEIAGAELIILGLACSPLAINTLVEAKRLILYLPAEDQDSLDKVANCLEAVYSQVVTL